MFESYLADILNSSLCKYIEDLDFNQLKISMWKGNIELKNLKIRKDALTDFNLPIQVIFGHLGKLILKVPWTNLYSQAVHATVEDLYVLVGPKYDVKYDAEKEEALEMAAKKSALRAIDDALQKEYDGDKVSSDPSFQERLIARIINNIQINVKNVHIRYEDLKMTGSPFACGVTLHNLELYTTDNNWVKFYLAEETNRVFKLARLDTFALYMNCDTEQFGTTATKEVLTIYRDNISTENNFIPRIHYVLGPLSLESKLSINTAPAQDDPPFSIPKFDFILQMDKVGLSINGAQFQNILNILEAFNRMTLAAPYRKYYPYGIPYKANGKVWWNYAINCILVERIRENNRKFQWDYIKNHLKLCRAYAEAYKETLLSAKPSATVIELCNLAEKKLDLFNLKLIRQRVFYEVQLYKEEMKTKKEEEKKSSGWFSGWFGTKKSDPELDIRSRLKAAMTPEEKKKLYKAIGYDENSTPLELPKFYIATKLYFQLNTFEIGLYEDYSSKASRGGVYYITNIRNILLIQLSTSNLTFLQRPGDNAMSIKSSVEEMKFLGYRKEKGLNKPVLVQSTDITTEENLFSIEYETNPLHTDLDQRLQLHTNSLRIVYDSETVLQLYTHFMPPKKINLSELEGAATLKISNFKERSATGMQYMLDKHAKVEIDINCKPNIVIIPYCGDYNAYDNIIVISLGTLEVLTKTRKYRQDMVNRMYEKGEEHDRILETIMNSAYDMYNITIADLQVIVTKGKENWAAVLLQHEETCVHILKPTSVIVDLRICIIDNDPRLPQCKVIVTLPGINLIVTEDRILEVMKIIFSIKFPIKHEEAKPILKRIQSNSSLKSYQLLRSTTPQVRRRLTVTPEVVQHTALDATISLQEFSITLYTSNDSRATPTKLLIKEEISNEQANTKNNDVASESEYFDASNIDDLLLVNNSNIRKILSLQIIMIRGYAAQRTFENVANASLGAICVNYYNKEGSGETIETFIIDTPGYKLDQIPLLNVSFYMVDKATPDFLSKYNSIEKLIEVKFSILNIKLHKENLLTLMKVVGRFTEEFLRIANIPLTSSSRDDFMDMESLSVKRSNLTVTKESFKADAKIKRNYIESIKFKVIANMELISLELTCKKRSLALLKIVELNAGVVMKLPYNEVECILKDIVLEDPNPLTKHTAFLSIVGKDAINCNVIMYNVAENLTGDAEDMKLSLEIGCVKVIYLNWFLVTIMNYMSYFSGASEAIVFAGAKAADAAKQNVLDVNKVTKVSLNVKVKAPIIIIPIDSQSNDAIVIDMGLLKANNVIKSTLCNECNNVVVIDEINLDLNDMKITRALMLDVSKSSKSVKIQGVDEVDYFYGYMTNFNILNRSSFLVNVKRNISFNTCKHFPLFDLSASLKVIEINLFTDDYNLVMSIANYNFKEGQSEFPRKMAKTANKPKYIQLKKTKEKHEQKFTGYEAVTPNKTLVQEQYRFNVNFDGFIINLMKSVTSGVAKFGMYLMSVKGKQLVNGTTTFNLILCNAQLEDKRPKIKSVYKTYLCRKDWLLWERIKKPQEDDILDNCTKETTHMIDFTCILTNRETIIKLAISGFDLIICVDFLYKLSEFFKSYTNMNIEEIPFAAAASDIDHKKVYADYYSSQALRSAKETLSQQNARGPQSKINKIMDINIVIEEPEIMLVENLEDVNTNAIIFNFQSEINFRALNDSKVIRGLIDGLKMYMCSFHPKQRANTRHYILHPCVVNINNSQPESSDFNVCIKFSDIMVNITPITIELISKAVKSITTTKSKKAAKLTTISYSNIWQERYVDERDHWYIRIDSAEDALSDGSLEELVEMATVYKNETCILEISSIIVILEMGIGYYTQPLISIETRLNAIMNNWSSNMSMQGSLILKVDYYNAVLAAWEPVVEPIERNTNDGDTYFETWYLDFNLWIDNVPSHYDSKQMNNVTRIKFQSTDNLLVTISKTFVELLAKMSISFQDAMHPSGLLKPSVIAPYLIENDTGYELMLDLTIGLFTLHESHTSGKYLGNINDTIDIILKDDKRPMSSDNLLRCKILLGGRVYLQLKEMFATKDFSEEDYNIYVQIIGSRNYVCLPISKADKRYFSVQQDFNRDIMGIVSEVNCEYGTTVINIHSVLNIENHFTSPIYVFYKKPGVRDMLDVGIANPNSVFHVPLQVVYNEYRYLYFNIDEYNISTNAVKWDDSPNDMKYTCQVQCEPLRSIGPLIINIEREKTEIFFENTNKFKLHSAYYTLHLRPPICLRNALPVDITVSVAGTAINMNEELDKILQMDIHRDSIKTIMQQSYHLLPKQSDIFDPEDISLQSSSDQFIQGDKPYKMSFNDDLLNYGEKEVRSGYSLYLPTMKISNRKDSNPKNYLVIKLIQYLEKDWVCVTEIVSAKNELYDWRFTSYDSDNPMHLDLYAKCEMHSNCLEVTLFSSFWLINKTDLMLSYKVDTETVGVLYHPSEYEGPIFFTFRSQNYFNKKTCAIRVDNGDWSKKIPLDVAGSSGFVTCKIRDKSYQIAVHNHITHNTLTKQITFMPYYMLVNKCSFLIEVQQYARPADPWKRLLEGDCKPLWPVDDFDRILVLKVSGQRTVPFKYSEPMCTLLALENNDIGGVNVEVHCTEGGVYVIFTEYHTGDAPGLIINYTSMPIQIVEKGVKTSKTLASRHKILFTWSNPIEERLLLFNKETNFNLLHDAVGNFKLNNQKIYWVSFLDGLQRVLLFTESKSIAKRSESTSLLQIIDRSIEINIHGVGISIVNNQTCTPILFMAITSSGIIWESRKDEHKRFKVLSLEDSGELEQLYQRFLLEKEQDPQAPGLYAITNKEVNFTNMTLRKEDKIRQMRRTFLPGAWIMLESSPFQLQLHMKVNRLQIDNQLHEYVFPVLLAPIPPPKTLSKSIHYKPFVECSLIQQIIPNSSIKQYKYASMLVQEFHFKIDLTLVMALLDMFFTSEVDEHLEVTLFREDIANITKPLSEVVRTHSQYDQKNFYDNLHLGPMKVHVSFSLSGVEPSSTPHIISKLIESVGVTLTDVNDVVLRLAFFERNNNFFTTKELLTEIKSHYIGQALKQIYVLVLGLDVLGNPYGLVVGFKRGVEDLFYEPYQGAIQGPGEFAEGLVLGMRSLFGHTIGGAANAVSKITGAMGKGLAVLTFDDEYQKKRRQALNKKPKSFHEGMAQSSKGLVMGFVDGVTGVVTKPISGAKEQGIGGFVKGLGKGTIGLVTRPTAGIVDFAHGTFDSVKRATDLNTEVKRLRPPRFQGKDGILRPYRLSEAKGHQLLKELEKGKFAVTDTFVYYDEIAGRNEHVLVTNYRILYVSRNETFAVWSLDWSFLFTEITRLITTDEGIEINLYREKRKLFYSSTVSKFIPMAMPKKREMLVKAIEEQIIHG